MRIAMITAGGAGMFCGSCMQDNTLARALRLAGADVLLVPTYTPIRVDEDNVSSSRIFLGGINVYLDSRMPGWRHMPRAVKRWLDRPGLVGWLSKLSSSTNAAELGSITMDLLKGIHGPQRTEIDELIQFLCDDYRPDLVLFSNALLSGIAPELRRRFPGRICCLLQGDDIFLEGLTEPWRGRAIRLVTENAAHFDALLTHSDYYAHFMQRYLGFPASRFRHIPLTIEAAPVRSTDASFPDIGESGPVHDFAPSVQVLTIGYFARICPEKGAFRFLRAAEHVLSNRADLKMVIAGYLLEQHRRHFETQLSVLTSKFGNRCQWKGSPESREDKFRLLASFDWLCVPTEYQEPKGLYVLEAALAGVPSLLPAHGAFPERIASLGIGQLYDPVESGALETAMLRLQKLDDSTDRELLRANCLKHFAMEESGHRVLNVLREIASGTQ